MDRFEALTEAMNRCAASLDSPESEKAKIKADLIEAWNKRYKED